MPRAQPGGWGKGKDPERGRGSSFQPPNPSPQPLAPSQGYAARLSPQAQAELPLASGTRRGAPTPALPLGALSCRRCFLNRQGCLFVLSPLCHAVFKSRPCSAAWLPGLAQRAMLWGGRAGEKQTPEDPRGWGARGIPLHPGEGTDGASWTQLPAPGRAVQPGSSLSSCSQSRQASMRSPGWGLGWQGGTVQGSRSASCPHGAAPRCPGRHPLTPGVPRGEHQHGTGTEPRENESSAASGAGEPLS